MKRITSLILVVIFLISNISIVFAGNEFTSLGSGKFSAVGSDGFSVGVYKNYSLPRA